MKKEILVTLPHPSFHGGVGQIFKVLNLSDEGNVEYFYNTQAGKSANPFFFLFMLLRFTYKLRGKKVVHLNPSFDAKAIVRDGTLSFIAKCMNRKVILFMHGWSDDFEQTVKQNGFFRKLLQIVFNRVDMYLLLGNIFAQKLNRLGVNCKQVNYLPTVAENSYFDIPNVKEDWKDGRVKLLFIAGFVPSKGMKIALETLSYLNENCEEYKFSLTMAGDGPELERCKQYAAEKGLTNVQFTGYISGKKKHEYFRDSDILFFPSLHGEGLPCAIMEAMLYGLAVVTRPVGGIPYWVKHEVNGWVSDSIDPVVFAEGIISLINRPDLLKKMKKLNHETAFNNFTPEKLKGKLQNIYGKALSEEMYTL